MSEDDLVELLRFYTVEEIGDICGVGANRVIAFIKKYFDLDYKRKNKCKIWNEDLERFEYCDALPISFDEFVIWLQEGHTVAELAARYRVKSKTAFHKYLLRSFGEDKLQLAYDRNRKMTSRHACIEKNSGELFANLGDLARHLWNNDKRISQEFSNVQRFNRVIRDHLVRKSEPTFQYLDYIIALI